MIGLAITLAVALIGYWQAKQFVRSKLRFVDAVHKASAPLLAGIAAVAVAMPVVWVLPLVGTGTAIAFGASVALGVNAGARDIRKRIGAGVV
jgi:hypothetical protein